MSGDNARLSNAQYEALRAQRQYENWNRYLCSFIGSIGIY